MLKLLTVILALALPKLPGGVSFDRTIHDWGDVCVSDGPLQCTFTLSNGSTSDVTILEVVSSCGCTGVEWSHESIPSGGKGTITATFKNEDGPAPFDKTLTVYLSCDERPTVLHLRGIVHEKPVSLAESHPVRFGPLGIRSSEVKAGNMFEGQSKSGEFSVANLGNEPISLSFSGISPGLRLNCRSTTLAPGEKTAVTFTVDAISGQYGKNWYYATPVVGGKSYKSSGKPAADTPTAGAETLRSDSNPTLAEGSSRIGIWAITKADFSGVSKENRLRGPMPKFEESTVSFGRAASGKKMEVTFKYTNAGHAPLNIMRIDCSSLSTTGPTEAGPVAEGASGTLKFTVDTSKLPAGESTILLSLYTNSPTRPIVHLYITGIIF